MRFFTYPKDSLPDLSGYILLTPKAPVLSQEDNSYGLFLIDGTWRYADLMLRNLPQPHRFISRSLPLHFHTAYPRRQEIEQGLASIEALFLAYHILGRDTTGLLDDYYWKEQFLLLNGRTENRRDSPKGDRL